MNKRSARWKTPNTTGGQKTGERIRNEEGETEGRAVWRNGAPPKAINVSARSRYET